jgi:hypothetical protein
MVAALHIGRTRTAYVVYFCVLPSVSQGILHWESDGCHSYHCNDMPCVVHDKPCWSTYVGIRRVEAFNLKALKSSKRHSRCIQIAVVRDSTDFVENYYVYVLTKHVSQVDNRISSVGDWAYEGRRVCH